MRRLATAATWPLGIALTSWSYMWRTTPLHRRELEGDREADRPPSIPDGVATDDFQLEGVGALYHRRYQARITEPELTVAELVAAIADDPNRAAPWGMARFKPREDRPELVVRMPGPWDGPIRIVERTPTSIRFATLDTHLEAGQIEWRAETAAGDNHGDRRDILFTVESWAQSGDRLSKLLYQHVRMAKEVQLHMWTSFLEGAAKLAKGRIVGGIDIETRRVDLDGDGAGGGRGD